MWEGLRPVQSKDVRLSQQLVGVFVPDSTRLHRRVEPALQASGTLAPERRKGKQS